MSNVDFGGVGDGVRVIYDRNGQNPVRIVVSATYRYHPGSNDVSQVIFHYVVSDDQTGCLDGDQSGLDPTASVIAAGILKGLKPDLDAAAEAVRAARRSQVVTS